MTGVARWWGRSPTTSPPTDIDLEGALDFITKKARSERRSGKPLSAESAAKVRQAIESLRRMLAAANTDGVSKWK